MAIGNEIKVRREELGWSQAKLAQMAGSKQQTVTRLESGDTKYSKDLAAILDTLGLGKDGSRMLGDPARQNGSYVPPPRVFDSVRKIPVHSAAEGGPEGALIVDIAPFEYVDRPSIVADVDEAYLIVITGDSMGERYRPGERAIVNPRKPPLPGADCIFRAEYADGEWKALIKELVRTTTTHWIVRQHNPEKELRLSRKEWQVCHRVVGRADRD